MSATNSFENSLLLLIFNGTTIANIADNAASSPATDLYISLHTGDPGEAGSQNTTEASYTSYARVAVARTSGGWTVSANNASNTAAVIFPTATGGSNTLTHFGIGLSSSGAGTLLFKGALGASLAVSNGITPRYEIGELDVNVD
mgnify:FL=1